MSARRPSIVRTLRAAAAALLLALATGVALPACHGDTEVHPAYMCPMECEGEKTYDHPGKCPICGMDLVQVHPPGSSAP